MLHIHLLPSMCSLVSGGVCQASYLQTPLLLQPLQSTLPEQSWAARSPTVITQGTPVSLMSMPGMLQILAEPLGQIGGAAQRVEQSY